MATKQHPDVRIAQINATYTDEAERLRAVILCVLDELRYACDVDECQCSANAIRARVALSRLQEGLGLPVTPVWGKNEERAR